jgi:retron-type reverse transcriptase
VSEVVRESDVLERVWKPKRVLAAWRQVKKNAGAAGIDQMSVEEFAERKTESVSNYCGSESVQRYRTAGCQDPER